MKYTINVVQTAEGYVGYAIAEGKAVYTSKSHNNPNSASNDVVNFIKTRATASQEFKKENNGEIDRSYIVPSSNAVRPSPASCCGRG